MFALPRCDLDDLLIACHAESAQLGRRIERLADDHERMMQHLHPPVLHRLGWRAARLAVTRHVEGDVAVEPLILALRVGIREQELRGAELLHAHAVIRQVDRARELRDLPDRQFAIGHRVLPDVWRRPLAFNRQRLYIQDLLPAAHRVGSVDRGLKFGRCPGTPAGGDE